MRTLRGRLLLGFLLPWLLISPLLVLTISSIYKTEEHLSQLATEINQNALTAIQNAQVSTRIFIEEDSAKAFLQSISESSEITSIQITLLNPNLEVIGSTLQKDQLAELPQIPPSENPAEVSFQINGDQAYLIVPIIGSTEQLTGLMIASRQLDLITAQLPRLRVQLLFVLVFEVILASIGGLILARKLSSDLEIISVAIAEIGRSDQLHHLPENGPEEFRILIRTFNNAVDRLEEAERSRQHLLANVVHELSRPIGAMQAAIQALQRGGDQDQQFRQDLLNGMQAQINLFEPILDNLIQLHSSGIGDIKLNRQPIDMNSWLPQTTATWQTAAIQKGLIWVNEFPEALPSVEIDPDLMAQVLGNLLSNAIKYTPEGGKITLGAVQIANTFQISVRDTGVGISPDEQDVIFIPFYRSQTDTRFPQGMGLGLAIAQQIVSAHDGRITIKSKRGQGSIFTIHLRLSQVSNSLTDK